LFLVINANNLISRWLKQILKQYFIINLKEKGRKFSLSPELCALCHHFLPGPFLKKGGMPAKINN